MGKPLTGKPVPVVGLSFKPNESALSEILLDMRVKDRQVVIISVAGAFRKGKSFLLDFILRYLNAPNDPNWLGDVDSPLNGFSWRGGSVRDTTGILMWSEPFIIKQEEGEVAVLLMDTQGTFDIQSTTKDCSTVFALSTMLSSVQIYNLSGQIQENDLQHLQYFTEYGRLALESNKDVKPFQTLQFLVRDWPNEHEYSNGEVGGRKLLERTLKVSDKQQPELRQLRNHIRSCFQTIDCYLMPHPGLKVTKPAFEGRLKDMEEDFQEHIKKYIEFLLHPKNLVVKKINGTIFTGKELLVYFKAYMNIFQGDTLPEIKPLFLATAEVNNMLAVDKALDAYRKEMDLICAPDKPHLTSKDLEREHERCAGKALTSFKQTRKMGDAEFHALYEAKLNLKLEANYKTYMTLNESKTLYTLNQALAIGSAVGVGGRAFAAALRAAGAAAAPAGVAAPPPIIAALQAAIAHFPMITAGAPVVPPAALVATNPLAAELLVLLGRFAAGAPVVPPAALVATNPLVAELMVELGRFAL